MTLYVTVQDVKLLLDLSTTCFECGRPVLLTQFWQKQDCRVALLLTQIYV